MAKPVSEEELQLKKRARRRLIGAIALVAAVAAVLPMVLDSEPKPTSQEVSIQIPAPGVKGSVATNAPGMPATATKAPPAAKGEAKVEPNTETKAPAAPAVTTAPAPVVAPVAPPVEKPVPKVVETAPAKAAEKPATAAAAGTPDKALAKAIERMTERGAEGAPEKGPAKGADKAAAPKAVPGSFFIQVIALADADKAKQSQQKIAEAGVRAYTEVVTTGGGKVTRVRAGPFATREEAEKAQAKLQGMGFEGKVGAY